ncbi:MAG: serine/threonine-protein kinase, partial [Myxococcota bacterium]
DALAYAHRRRVVHRDLKPSNVMLVADGPREAVKLLDFGIATISDPEGSRITMSTSLLGTPTYMAPEQIINPTSVGPSADLYSLGVMLYEMLAGRAPFAGGTIEVVEKQLGEPPPPLPTETGLEPLIFDLLAKEVDRRPPSGEAVSARLEQLTNTSRTIVASASVHRPAPPRTTPEPRISVDHQSPNYRRWPLLIGVPSAAAFLSALITGILLSQPTEVPTMVTPTEEEPVPPRITQPVESLPPMAPAPIADRQTISTVRRRLVQLGLTDADIQQDIRLTEGLRNLEQAIETRDAEAIDRAQTFMTNAIRQAATAERVIARLDAIERRLIEVGERLPDSISSRIVRRHAELARRAAEPMDASARQTLLIQTTALEEDLENAVATSAL